MKTELLTVSKVFNEALFRIPDYQRGYSCRGVKILDFMEQRWNMKIGNREQKIKALGLAFLDPLI